jgi:uncharacterized phosphosugar-binding protein
MSEYREFEIPCHRGTSTLTLGVTYVASSFQEALNLAIRDGYTPLMHVYRFTNATGFVASR